MRTLLLSTLLCITLTAWTGAMTRAAEPARNAAVEWRRAAAENVISGTILRVDAAAEAVAGPRLGGYLIRAGTEQPLPENALQELLTLLRSDAGFNDRIQKRCVPGTSVGIKLARQPVAGATGTDLVLDFGCDRLIVSTSVSAAGSRATFFDPARAAWIAFVQRALPRDTELQRLR